MTPTQPIHRNSLLHLAVILSLLGLGSLMLDVQIAQALAKYSQPKILGQMVRFSEIFGHGTGAAMLLIGAFVIGGIRLGRSQDRTFTLRLIGSTYLGSLVVDILKLLITRVRPRAALFNDHISWINTFGKELLRADIHSRASLMSFPSGHSAVAAGLAATLSWYYPRGSHVFSTFALFACIQRLVSESHYLSDVFFGAALGLLGAWICLPSKTANR